MVIENVITVVDVHCSKRISFKDQEESRRVVQRILFGTQIRWTTRLDSSWSCYHWGWGGPSVLGLWCHTTKCIEAGETAFSALALTTFLDLSVLQSYHMYCNKGQLFESSNMFNLPLVPWLGDPFWIFGTYVAARDVIWICLMESPTYISQIGYNNENMFHPLFVAPLFSTLSLFI